MLTENIDQNPGFRVLDQYYKKTILVMALVFTLTLVKAGGTDSEYLKLSEFFKISSKQPITVCIAFEEEMLKSVLQKKQHLAIVVKSYQPIKDSSSSFKISLIDNERRSQFLSQFGLYPGDPFNANSESEYQRFYIPISKFEGRVESQNELCFEITLDPLNKEISLIASAELAIELSNAFQ